MPGRVSLHRTTDLDSLTPDGAGGYTLVFTDTQTSHLTNVQVLYVTDGNQALI
jgi:hypothetical protein